MEPNEKAAVEYCRHFASLCGVSCVLLRLSPEPAVVGEADGWLCRCRHACDFCNTFHYGCSEAYRWNGKYTFFCPMGLAFVAVSLTDGRGAYAGGMVMGPVVMGELSDTVSSLADRSLAANVARLPQWNPDRIHHAEEVLSAVASAISGVPQGCYGSFVFEQDKMLSKLYEIKDEMRQKSENAHYLIDKENQLRNLMVQQDKEGVQNLLNQILGCIFFNENNDLSAIKARLIELLVLLSRAAIDAGAEIQEIFLFNEQNIRQIQQLPNIEDLSLWVTAIIHRFVQYSFDFSTVKHSDTLYKIMQYVKCNYNRKITLEDIASYVCLSKSYVSSIFKEEMGECLCTYINRIRVEKSKALLLNESVSLADVGGLCGFDDQSYFTKVFRSIVGVSPKKYRECRGMSKYRKPA